ncbi:hypothetical protein SUGI_0581760 [Cryptomeria japonica]|uniref:xanthotoxin 5-hydroxylase CYP82C4 n=1 Tax=Cryptomeria japonica TaxID=3369 RepID=UPI0024147BF3|nr:xanthotoxin 5-hydroxylase CYP82C4 [Cryptomeria japonica]GLJ29511.1 hypothetical protein SUGI_0581760 [Cryptomeria japonica]
MALDLTILTVLVFVVLLIAKHFRRKSKKKIYAPSPQSWPIIGHMHLLLKKKPIHRTLYSLSEIYGPIMQLQLGNRSVLVITSSQMAKECFTVNDKAFASRPRLYIGKHMGYEYKSLGWAPYGSYWRNIRKICTLQLFSASRIRSFRHVREEETSVLIRSMFESCEEEGGNSTVNMKSRLAQLTFNIIMRMVAGRISLGVEEYKGVQRFKEMIDEGFLLAGAFNLGDYLPFLEWFDLYGFQAAVKRLHRKRDGIVQMLVDNHRKEGGTETEDLIDVLISASDDGKIMSENSDDVVKATAINIINGGKDTSSVTIEWALSALLQNPDIMIKAQEELDTHVGRDRMLEESDLPQLKYLEAIVKETLRLYPAAPVLVPHESIENCTVGGFHVPAGTRLMVNAWAIQRDPTIWDRPDEFDPDRFLKSAGKEIDVKGQNFELIPFGSGRRMCPGMSFALCVVTYTVGRLLQSFEWGVAGGGATIDMREGFGLTMPRAVPLEALIKPRLPRHLY